MHEQADPGELFLIQNAGDIIATVGGVEGGVVASIEYAMRTLRVGQ
jgi:carbonic anhydrase